MEMMMMESDHSCNFLRPNTLHPCEGGWLLSCCDSCGMVFKDDTNNNSVLKALSKKRTYASFIAKRKRARKTKINNIEDHDLEQYDGLFNDDTKSYSVSKGDPRKRTAYDSFMATRKRARKTKINNIENNDLEESVGSNF
ncbi:uncharacterized protein LOC123921924 [Trifolium pratense]|uniref:uncharacterized protein LOC123921924 n=1 Tax=Trifolium pratense TaxID=57577 RepID=UPI001E693D8F|nr:uncharacterized protein LOC123921924 [Trifolium pratense]